MTTLKIYGNITTNLFGLNGQDENSATFALGWVLANCDVFLKSVIKDITKTKLGIDKVLIDLQKHSKDSGITDIEILSGNDLHIIIEAKKYWQLPDTVRIPANVNTHSGLS